MHTPKSIFEIDGFTFYIHDDKLKTYSNYSKQIVYLTSKLRIIRLNLFLGHTKNYINSIESFETFTGIKTYENLDFQHHLLKNLDKLLIQILENNSHLGSINCSFTNFKMNETILELLDNDFQKENSKQLITSILLYL